MHDRRSTRTRRPNRKYQEDENETSESPLPGSDDSDSDDSLLASAFNKPKRRKNTSDDFLDQCLDEEQNRFELKKKICLTNGDTNTAIDNEYWDRIEKVRKSENDATSNDKENDPNIDNSSFVLGVRNMLFHSREEKTERNVRNANRSIRNNDTIQLLDSMEDISKIVASYGSFPSLSLEHVLYEMLKPKKQFNEKITFYLYRKALMKHGSKTVSKGLCNLLLSIACSTAGNELLSVGAYRTLEDIIIKCPEVPTWSIQDFNDGLYTLFGLLPEEGEPNNFCHENWGGLGNYLKIWCTLVRSRHVIDDGNMCNALLNLMRMSLDPVFHHGFDVLKTLCELTFLLVEAFGKEEELLSQDAISSIFVRFQKRIPSPIPNSEDEDDEQNYLATSLAIRSFIEPTSPNSQVSIISTRFKASISIAALKQMCFFKEDDMDHFRKSCQDVGLGNDSSSIWEEYMSVSKMAYHDIEYCIEEHIENGPRLLAAVELARMISEMAEILFDKSCIENVNVMASTFEALEVHCHKIRSKIRNVFSKPHLRRVKDKLIWHIQMYKNRKEELGFRDGGVPKQQTLDAWMKKDDDDDDDENSI